MSLLAELAAPDHTRLFVAVSLGPVVACGKSRFCHALPDQLAIVAVLIAVWVCACPPETAMLEGGAQAGTAAGTRTRVVRVSLRIRLRAAEIPIVCAWCLIGGYFPNTVNQWAPNAPIDGGVNGVPATLSVFYGGNACYPSRRRSHIHSHNGHARKHRDL